MGDRNISDVVLDLESKVDNLLKTVNVIDINVKAVLNKLNLSAKSAVAVKPEPDDTLFTQAGQEPVLVNPKPPTVTTTTRKSVVQQKVTYSDGKPVILGNVTIADFDLKTNIIDKPKTDRHGRWHSLLFGGKYSVTIVKGPTAAKPPFKIEYDIVVPNDGKPIELEGKQLE